MILGLIWLSFLPVRYFSGGGSGIDILADAGRERERGNDEKKDEISGNRG